MTAPATAETTAVERTLVGPSLPEWLEALTGETLVELLERAAERTPEATALVMRHGMQTERWSYRLLAERSRRVAAILARHGVEPGSRVVTWAPNDPWLVAAYLGVWYRGALVVPLDLRMKEDVAERIGRRTEPALVLAGLDLPEGVRRRSARRSCGSPGRPSILRPKGPSRRRWAVRAGSRRSRSRSDRARWSDRCGIRGSPRRISGGSCCERGRTPPR